MTDTGLIGDTEPAPGFELVDGSLVDATNSYDPSAGGAAGAMQSTSRDSSCSPPTSPTARSCRPSPQAAMQSFLPAEDLTQFGIDHGYGLGLDSYIMDDMTLLGHLGTGETGTSYFGYDAEHGRRRRRHHQHSHRRAIGDHGHRSPHRHQPERVNPTDVCTTGRRPPVSNSGSLSGR